MVEERSRKERLEAKTRRLKAKLFQEVFVWQRMILLLIPVAIIGFLALSISALNRNLTVRQEIIEREAEFSYLTLQIEEYELENQYYASEEYQELAARRLQNKKLKGETLVYLPKNTERAKSKYQTATNEVQKLLSEKSNFDQWLSFLFNL